MGDRTNACGRPSGVYEAGGRDRIFAEGIARNRTSNCYNVSPGLGQLSPMQD